MPATKKNGIEERRFRIRVSDDS